MTISFINVSCRIPSIITPDNADLRLTELVVKLD